MTDTTTHDWPTLPRIRRGLDLDAFFAGVGQGFNAYVQRRSRMEEIERLNAMTDEELAARGLTRDRIPHHVFGDLLNL